MITTKEHPISSNVLIVRWAENQFSRQLSDQHLTAR